MKKLFLFISILLVVISCTVSFPSSSIDRDVETGVAVAFTQTALAAAQPNPSASLTPESTLSPSPTLTQTPPADDPKALLGDPDWLDDLSSEKNWSLDAVNESIGEEVYSHSKGKLNARNSYSYNWLLTYFSFRDAYLEAKFEIETCSKNDQYGLVVRAEDYGDGDAYYFTVTCDGQFDLRRETPSGSTLLLDMPSSDVINSGSDQTNTLGIWLEGSTIRLYANNQFLTEVKDNSIDTDGHFGIFVNSNQTPGFTIHVDEIAYWLID